MSYFCTWANEGLLQEAGEEKSYRRLCGETAGTFHPFLAGGCWKEGLSFVRDVDFKGDLRSYRTNQAKTIRKWAWQSASIWGLYQKELEMGKFTGSCKGSNLQGGIVWPGLNYLFIVNLFIYVCANDLAAAGAKAPLKRPGILDPGLEYWSI